MPDEIDQPKILESYSEQVIKHGPDKRWKYLAAAIGVALVLYLLLVWLLLFRKPSPSGNQVNEAGNPAVVTVVPEWETASEVQITVSELGFIPQTLVIKRGSKVTWVNKDKAPHKIALDFSKIKVRLADFMPQTLSQGASFSYIFWESGSFPYYDSQSPAGTRAASFRGQIVVK